MSEGNWVAHKFGGTSVGNADRYRAVVEILKKESGVKQAIVVSAMSKVTDALIELVEAARRRDESYTSKLDVLKKRHIDTVIDLLGEENSAKLRSTLASDFEDIAEILRGVWLIKTYSDRTIELVSGYGEIWSAQFLNALFHHEKIPSQWLDAREVLVIEPLDRMVVVNWEASQRKIDAWLESHPGDRLVITGFIASTKDGVATTLRRNGSDYSASIFGALLNASVITIWTDVDGVLSSDPKLVPDAVILDELSYNEVTELAYFGAKVVHPATMAPAIQKKIPIFIRNTFNPTHPGTKIHAEAFSDRTVKGFAAIEDMALVNVEGTGMIGVPGIAERLFRGLRESGISVAMISQASSEHSICFAVPKEFADKAKSTLELVFGTEIQQGLIQSVKVTEGCSILAAVGDNMAQHPGVSATFFNALGRTGINVRAIAQGSSERNISAVIDQKDAKKALRAVHSAFYLSNQTISIGLIGPGLIGGTFLRQMNEQLQKLKTERRIDLRVRGIMNSRTMLLDDQHIPLESWKQRLVESSNRSDIDAFVAHLHSGSLPHTVIIDATASSDIPMFYPHWLESGINIITPNKKANTAAIGLYRRLRSIMRTTNKYYFYSTTVGAGLPVIHTLKDLVQTGDDISLIEGVLSGTLSYIFNSFTGEQPFSQIVSEARAKGYTEPDPRDDLSSTSKSAQCPCRTSFPNLCAN
jgi:aspartokinase/homoserine dehydrogenase 1